MKTAAAPPIPAADLAHFTTTPEGNLEVTLERFGRLSIRFPNSPITLDVYVKRDADRNFRCFVTSDAVGDEKSLARLRKGNAGELPGATMVLHANGVLVPEEKPDRNRRNATGRAAATADQQPAEAAPEAAPQI